MAYALFAQYYDALTSNVDYVARARYFDSLLRSEREGERGILLDVGCGTGSLSFALAELGYDVIGVDPSEEMLAVAMQKRAECGRQDILFLCQAMEELDLYGTVDAAVCALDTINHIPDEAVLFAGLRRVSLFLAPGGIFAFDVNTPYKHREILADNAFVYDTVQVFCVWQNQYRREHDSVDITLDFFRPAGKDSYIRGSESFTERIYGDDCIRELLCEAGLELLHVYADGTADPPDPRTERLVYVACKPPKP